jgi:4-amino-4-deoxy-L-arabinose transferase-like glycosyltransferase
MKEDATLASVVARLVWVVLIIVSGWTIVSTWYLNLELMLGWSTGVVVLALLGSGTTMAGVLWGARILQNAASEVGTRSLSLTWPIFVIAGGLAGRLAWALTFQGPLLSDYATYFKLAERLYMEGIYEDVRGDRAYWPPGYPLFLVAGFAVVGVRSWVPLAGNLILYVATSVTTYRIGQLFLGAQAGRLAVLLLAIWPNYIFSAGIGSKEMLVTALLPVALLQYLRAIAPLESGFVSDTRLVCSGVLLGLASLAQPSMMLFPGILACQAILRRNSLLRTTRQMAVVIAGMAAVMTPWTARNLQVLNAFIPISTNGGDVFYRANNPLATGGYTPVGERPLLHLPEGERNRIGYQLGLEWILTHPDRFVVLAVKKQVRFLGDDSHGAFETLKRDRGNTLLYLAAKAVSNLYWLGLWALILLALLLRPRLFQTPAVVLVALPFFYLLAIDSVFESSGRHHVPAMGFLAILASGSLPFGHRQAV